MHDPARPLSDGRGMADDCPQLRVEHRCLWLPFSLMSTGLRETWQEICCWTAGIQ